MIRVRVLLQAPHLLFHASASRLNNRSRPHVHQPGAADDMDLATATKVVFSPPPRRKKFGLDFHLWQFFVALLPPFAVYLTAQYARYEMRKMEKEKELFQAALKKAEEAAKDSTDTSLEFPNEPLQEKKSNIKDLPVLVDNRVNDQLKGGHSVMVRSDELQELKARLEAMEEKFKELGLAKANNGALIASKAADGKSGSAVEKQEGAVEAAGIKQMNASQREEGKGGKDSHGSNQAEQGQNTDKRAL